MGFVEAIQSGFNHYVTFSGRAQRSAYWYWTLFVVVLSIVLNIVDNVLGTFGLIGGLVSLALILPGLSVAIRRLHDLDRTGWWLLIMLTGIGILLILVWFCMRGTVGPNSYGPDPLGG